MLLCQDLEFPVFRTCTSLDFVTCFETDLDSAMLWSSLHARCCGSSVKHHHQTEKNTMYGSFVGPFTIPFGGAVDGLTLIPSHSPLLSYGYITPPGGSVRSGMTTVGPHLFRFFNRPTAAPDCEMEREGFFRPIVPPIVPMYWKKGVKDRMELGI